MFEFFCADKPDSRDWPPIFPDHETAALDLTHWHEAIAVPAVRRIG